MIHSILLHVCPASFLVPMLAASGTYAVLSACVCMYVCVSVCVRVCVCVCV